MRTALRILLWAAILLVVYYHVHNWVAWKDTSIWALISVLVLFAAIILTLFNFLQKKNVINRSLLLNLSVFVVSINGAVLIAEMLLRFFAPSLQTYGERNGSNIYHSSYDCYVHHCDSCPGGAYYMNGPNSEEKFFKPEFHYLHKYNSLGLRDREFTVSKASNEFRIMGLGDSFVEGVGTSADSTWLKQLEYLLNSQGGGNVSYTTMNGGAHGSDLFFSYDLFIHCLQKYKPDLVILNLNSTDVGDIVYRGCYERFDSNGIYVGKKGPWWEFFFGNSYIVRLITIKITHYDWQLLSPASKKREEDRIITEMGHKINDYQALAEKNNFAFLLILQPLQDDLRNPPNQLDRLKFDPSISKIDLSPVLKDSIHAQRDNYAVFYWPVDGHFTTRGYALEAKTIFREYFAEKDSL